MGLGRRILDGARANLNALMERALRDELSEMSETQLADELGRRQRERSEQEAERQQRLATEAAAKARGSARKKSGESPRASRVGEARARQVRLHELYVVLGVRVGAPLDEVKKAYRALMREHHPDRHAGDPAAEAEAGSRAAAISAAYTELEALLQA